MFFCKLCMIINIIIILLSHLIVYDHSLNQLTVASYVSHDCWHCGCHDCCHKCVHTLTRTCRGCVPQLSLYVEPLRPISSNNTVWHRLAYADCIQRKLEFTY